MLSIQNLLKHAWEIYPKCLIDYNIFEKKRNLLKYFAAHDSYAYTRPYRALDQKHPGGNGK